MKNENKHITKEKYNKRVLVELEYHGTLDKSTKEQLLIECLMERSAKNKAYSFILQSGLYHEWEYFFYNDKLKDSADK